MTSQRGYRCYYHVSPIPLLIAAVLGRHFFLSSDQTTMPLFRHVAVGFLPKLPARIEELRHRVPW